MIVLHNYRPSIVFVLFVFLTLIIAGCLQPPTKVGCCLKANATAGEGCVLYDDTTDEMKDLRADTHLESDGTKCNVTGNYCNVTYNSSMPAYKIPICTEADITTCRQPDCRAMVCGDFKFSPPIVPALRADEDNKVTTDVPASNQEETAIQFYRAQCRFLSMDGNLKKIMKNTKSSINIFRFGVGGSFDEYEQYRYLFPVSDKFCAVNPPRLGERRVDRYMNYLNPSTKETFDPITEITNDCIGESVGSEEDPLPPFRFDESSIPSKSGEFVQDGDHTDYEYSTVLPDVYNYKFAHWGRLDYEISTTSVTGYKTEYPDPYGPGVSVPIYSFTGYDLHNPFFNESSVYKKIDNSYYKKWLSIAHANTMYGISSSAEATTRAPFECDITSTECYSGVCGISTYSRAVMLSPPDASGHVEEVVTDCESYTDEFRQTRIVCAPTKSVVSSGSPTLPPTRTYAKVDAALTHSSGPGWDDTRTSGCGVFNKEHMTRFLYLYGGGGWTYDPPLSDYTCPNVMSSPYITWPKATVNIGTITNSADPSKLLYSYNGSGTWEVTFTEASTGPPAGGALFFGKTDPEATYKGKKVIGYALATPSEVDDLYVVKKCGMIEGKNYEVIAVPDNMSRWGELKNTFEGYFKKRYSGLTAINPEDDCGATRCELYEDAGVRSCANFYDFFWPSLPWVINFEKQANPILILEDDDTEWDDFELDHDEFSVPPARLLLASEIGMGMKKINRFSENYATASDADTCALRRLSSGGWITPGKRYSDGTNYFVWVGTHGVWYSLLYSKYIVLFYDNGTQTIGSKCALDPASGMPKIKTYGWCEPCTTSTLAYQKVETGDMTYVPGGIANIENGGEINLDSMQSRICIGSNDELQCANNLISGMNDYSMEKKTPVLSPSTIPEASVLKERLGNYMKSGVMPVLDLSNESNWIPKSDGSETSEYDFQRLIGKMGAAVVIVEHVNDSTDAAAKAPAIANRTALIRNRCFGCLTAFHVDSPSDNYSLDNITNTVFSSSYAAKFSTDMVTYDYSITQHSASAPITQAFTYVLFNNPGANLTKEYSKIIVDDMYGHSLVLLQHYGKSSMIVGLNLNSNDPIWTPGKYSALLEEITMSQDKFIKAGMVGIIYAPVRDSNHNPSASGLVDVDLEGVGYKNSKFCAMQNALYKMTATPPIAMYLMTNTVNQSVCVPCSSLEKTQGACNSDALLCDDGVQCTAPIGSSISDITGTYKCEDNTIVHNNESSSTECKLCTEMTGTYSCLFKYSNGTTQVRTGSMNELSSDAYLDILGGIEKPNKCCLGSAYGQRYTYVKKSMPNSINKPISFSKTGDQNVDCGMGVDMTSITQAQSFCNMRMPLKDYDVTCEVSG